MITAERIDEIIADVKTAYFEQIERDYEAWKKYRGERPQMLRTMPELMDMRFKDLRSVVNALRSLQYAAEISCKEEQA